MVIESPVPQEQPLAASADSIKASYLEASHSTPPEPAPMAAPGDSNVNGIDGTNEGQRQQQGPNMSNGVYPYPYPPPGAMYPVPPPEMYQAGMGPSGPRMMAPVPYPYPPPQPGQHGQPMPPNGYAFPTMMAPPPQNGNNGASPTSPTVPPSQYPFMWVPMPPPPGMVSQNGLPVPMNSSLPPPNYHGHPAQNQGDMSGAQPVQENGGPQQHQHQQHQQHAQQQHQQQQSPSGEQQNGATWTPGPGGLPPKEVAKTIPCRYFPDCRFGASCWFLHPGAETSNQAQAPPQPEGQYGRPYFPGPLPPPVRYGPSGPWDPSATSPTTNGASPDANKNAYPTPPSATSANNYGLVYAYPYQNGYPTPYPPPQQQATPGPAASAPQSPPQPSHHMSPQNFPQQLHQNPPSHPHSPSIPTPPTGIPVMYPGNGMPGPWYPAPAGSFHPQNMQMQGAPPLQPLSPSQQGQGMVPMSPVSPSMGPGPVPVQSMGMGQAMSPVHGQAPLQPMHPNSIPYPISPPYTSPRLHPKSPPQAMHPLSPQTHPGSPQSLYGHQLPPPPVMPVMPGHHSRRESMSSMSAVPMGAILGAHLDGNANVDGTRSPPSAFREMDGGFARRGRGGHSQRGSWGSNQFGSHSRKPPCAFYPAGKCKNGDQCRFPHVMPDENTPISPISPRGGYPGSFGRMSNGRRPTILSSIDDKMADLSVKEQNEGVENPDAGPRSAGIPKPYSSPKIRTGRAPLSTPSTPINRQNAHLHSHQVTPSQRIPSADDFPVLGGTATPPSGNGAAYGSAWGGPTAAQVLKGGIGAKKPANANNGAEGGRTDVEQDGGDVFRAPEKSVNGSAVDVPAI